MAAGLNWGDFTEAEWLILKDLLLIEPSNQGQGRSLEQNRSLINGILYRLRCGPPWPDVPPSTRVGTPSTARVCSTPLPKPSGDHSPSI
ncbi:transposase [Novosphingopyxis sp. YJ-S2-01]|uniref:transposase n=1 Tax=Novosphingopyxis sp. YJ-S2-01 TaxID=2794021 RepID=UPI0018DDB0C7|nr:transposase [Novosphingopyxis sp. YJ-S2-01]